MTELGDGAYNAQALGRYVKAALLHLRQAEDIAELAGIALNVNEHDVPVTGLIRAPARPWRIPTCGPSTSVPTVPAFRRRTRPVSSGATPRAERYRNHRGPGPGRRGWWPAGLRGPALGAGLPRSGRRVERPGRGGRAVRTAYVAWAICQARSLPKLRGAVTEIGLEDETVAREAPTPLSSVSQPSTCPRHRRLNCLSNQSSRRVSRRPWARSLKARHRQQPRGPGGRPAGDDPRGSAALSRCALPWAGPGM